MDKNCSDNDDSLSPSQILDRLQVLRQMQLLQREKIQKQRLQYQDSPETSSGSGVTETVSHFSNSTSYNTFRSLLQSPHVTSNDSTPRLNTSNLFQKVNEIDLIDGVSVLNLSRESEYIINSPTSTASRQSAPSETQVNNGKSPPNKSLRKDVLANKHISLDEMPILSPKKDFEALVLEKLQCDKKPSEVKSQKKPNLLNKNKKSFLRRGEGMSRFGLKKNDLVIQNTKSLPWRRKKFENKNYNSPLRNNYNKPHKNNIEEAQVQILVTETKPSSISKQQEIRPTKTDQKELPKMAKRNGNACENVEELIDTSNCEIHSQSKPINKPEEKLIQLPKLKHPLLANKGKTWAAIFTKEQDDFLRQLKQSHYYKNFTSPAKSTASDVSTNEVLSKLQQEREIAEQNMFELLETKVSHESFNLENSFLSKFLRKSKLECSGESTPLIMQKCVVNNPNLMHIFPDLTYKRRNENSQSDSDTCISEYTECSDCSTCCSCKTVEEINSTPQNSMKRKQNKSYATGHENEMSMVSKEDDLPVPENHKCQEDTVTENDMKADMAEMNAKLLATSDLLKDRLHELEDEIETFRKENANLSKMREEIDTERQKFYEEKAAFEQKFNEEKILSEYYLAEEKEKLTKQKQIYERYVREMRGRLNKKEKDEVINLKKEINDCKEEIRMKDAKSTSTIARLRNQLKIMEKEKKDLQVEVEKLKKENRRIQHSNEVTRRLTNIKYLEEINKKLSNMAGKDTQSEIDSNIKYKAFEIERQSRHKKIQPAIKNTLRPRAKSVPNLNVTSRYAKYFSQRDAISQMERNKSVNIERMGTYTYPSYNDDVNDYYRCDDDPSSLDETDSIQDKSINDNEDENNLEKIYMETFHSTSPKSEKSSLININDKNLESNNVNGNEFFIRKSNSSSNSARESNSPNRNSEFMHLENLSTSSKSPVSVLSYRSTNTYKSPLEDGNLMRTEHQTNISRSSSSINRPKSPVSILSNRSSSIQKSTMVINKEQYMDKTMVVSPEPSTSKTSLSRSNLNPLEIKKPDGSKELRFPNGNVKYISADHKYSKFVYYNGDVKENFYDEGRIKYYYAETKTFHTTHPDGLEVLEFSDGQVEKRYKDGSSEIRLPNGSVRYFDPKNSHVREEWRFPDGARLTVNADGEQRIVFANGQVEVHAKDHKRREFPDGTVKLVYNDGTSETRYASGRIRIKDKHGNLIMDSAPG